LVHPFQFEEKAHRPVSKLQALVKQVETCRLCPLCRGRHQAVPGEGNENATVLLIGEGPGYHEDREGRPFIGPAGQFLEELLGLAGLRRADVYITNVVKCRPPNNRDPLPVEIDACAPYLDRQIAAINPKVIITLGRYSMARFVDETSISRIHGQVWPQQGRVVVTMYHPAAGLHNDRLKDVIREDFRKLPGIIEQAQRAPTPAARPAAPPPAADSLAVLDAYAALVAAPEPPTAPADEQQAAGSEQRAGIESAPTAQAPVDEPVVSSLVNVAEAPAPVEAVAPEPAPRPRRSRKAATPQPPVEVAAPEVAPDVPTTNGHVSAEEAAVVTTGVASPETVEAETAVAPSPAPPRLDPAPTLEPPPSPVAPEPAAPPRKKGKTAPAAEQLSLF
jgi:DNA polymerase